MLSFLFLWGILLFWFPLAWMLDCYIQSGDFLDFIKNNTGLVNIVSSENPWKIKLFNFSEYPYIALKKLTAVLPLILFGIYQYITNKNNSLKKTIIVMMMSIIFLLTLSLATSFSGHSQNMRERIPFICVIFMLPLPAASLDILWSSNNKNRLFSRVLFSIIIILIISPNLSRHSTPPNSNWMLGTDTIATGNFLRHEFKTWNLLPTKNLRHYDIDVWTPWDISALGSYGIIEGTSGRMDLINPKWYRGNYPGPDFWITQDNSICITGFRKLVTPPGKHLFDIGRYSFYKKGEIFPYIASQIEGMEKEVELIVNQEYKSTIKIKNIGNSTWGKGFAGMQEKLVCQLIEPLSPHGPDILRWERVLPINKKVGPEEDIIISPSFQAPDKRGCYILDIYLMWGAVPVYPAPHRVSRTIIKINPRWKAEIHPKIKINRWNPGSQKTIPVEVTNNTDWVWKNKKPGEVTLSGHWVTEFGEIAKRDVERTYLSEELAPGESTLIKIKITRPPENSDAMNFYFDLVNEGKEWFGLWVPGYMEKKEH
mgnify:FL=1